MQIALKLSPTVTVNPNAVVALSQMRPPVDEPTVIVYLSGGAVVRVPGDTDTVARIITDTVVDGGTLAAVLGDGEAAIAARQIEAEAAADAAFDSEDARQQAAEQRANENEETRQAELRRRAEQAETQRAHAAGAPDALRK